MLGRPLELGVPIRAEFPIFAAGAKARPLAYLDTAASAQKPHGVIDRMSRYLSTQHANIHRGAYTLSAEATRMYDEARLCVARFIGAKDAREVIFTRGTTESINLVAHAYEKFLSAGDVVLLTVLEHHSNIVPWQLLAQRKQVRLEFVGITAQGEIDRADYENKVKTLRPKLVAMTHVSNALGTIVPIEEFALIAREAGAKVLVDAAQSAPHSVLNVTKLGIDFLAFSGHKLYGPTGIGVLFGRYSILEAMDPFMGGGDMIRSVAEQGSTWAEPPSKFEAGTPAIAEAIALGTAIEFIKAVGLEPIHHHEQKLFEFGLEKLRAESGVSVYGPAVHSKPQASILSFNVNGVHAHDLSTVADEFNVQIRAGHHCAMPLLKRLGIQSSARASLGMYSCRDDFEQLIEAIRRAKKLFL